MNDASNMHDQANLSRLLPNEPVATPCFVIIEDGIRHNLRRTADAAGGVARLMPHVKTHRAGWIVRLLLDEGVTAFKCATPSEVEMVLAAGGKAATWSYTSVNPARVQQFVALAQRYPDAEITGMLDSERGLDVWRDALRGAPDNIRLRIDLDPGLGRTGAPMDERALKLARAVHALGRLAGWHVYDGHVKGTPEERRAQVEAEAEKVAALSKTLEAEGIATDVVAGGSYTFNHWPHDAARFVSPGSWTYSSAQHDLELPELGWTPAAFVLATVISIHDGTATLDAGAKAISPDKPLAERFRWDGRIMLMNEEHTVVEARDLAVGDRVFLMPQHACTTAYLYDKAMVRTAAGHWDERAQLGCVR
jgi:D-serine deaminase-like pyridoxal phosphate-dependent protein